MKDRPTSIRVDILPGMLTVCSEYSIYNVNLDRDKTIRIL